MSERRGARDRLNVVLGYQFQSTHYDSDRLASNLEAMFARAVAAYNQLPGAVAATLAFRRLSAGYGEHLFNEIARDIISADIAVFETSDLNPNVMLELGVALTWGVRVFVIKQEGRDKPPSDIFGHTWADHRDSASVFPDSTHDEKLLRMVERAVRKKSRPQPGASAVKRCMNLTVEPWKRRLRRRIICVRPQIMLGVMQKQPIVRHDRAASSRIRRPHPTPRV